MAGENADQVDVAMQFLPLAPAQFANCPLVRGCGQRNQEKESGKAAVTKGRLKMSLAISST
jgi:hypothetical protein